LPDRLSRSLAPVSEKIRGIDTSAPNPARVYDYLLGGKDNFEVDRVTAQAGIGAFPKIVQSARACRAFLARVVRYLAESGVRQFLDIGTGLPSGQNVHEVAQAVAPTSRIVYVDNDRCKSGCAHTQSAETRSKSCLRFRPAALDCASIMDR
jgi:hypothetical protein